MNETSQDPKIKNTITLLLNELDSTHAGIISTLGQMHKSLVVFYVPLLFAIGYAIAKRQGEADNINAVFVGAPLILGAYIGYLAFLAFAQKSIENYRIKIEEAMESYVFENPAIRHQSKFVFNFFFNTFESRIATSIFFGFSVAVPVILVALIIFPSIYCAPEYIETQFGKVYMYTWSAVVGAFLIAEIIIGIKAFSPRTYK